MNKWIGPLSHVSVTGCQTTSKCSVNSTKNMYHKSDAFIWIKKFNFREKNKFPFYPRTLDQHKHIPNHLFCCCVLSFCRFVFLHFCCFVVGAGVVVVVDSFIHSIHLSSMPWKIPGNLTYLCFHDFWYVVICDDWFWWFHK